MEDMEGCNIFGHLDVSRVAGNFHISVQAQSFYHMKKTQNEIVQAIARFQQSLRHGQLNPQALQVCPQQ